MQSLSLGETRKFLMVLLPVKWVLDTIPTTDLFDVFTKTLCVWYDYVALTLNFFGGSRGTVSTLVVNPITGLPGRPVEPFLHPAQSPLGTLCLGTTRNPSSLGLTTLLLTIIPVCSGHAQWACLSPYKVLSFSYSFRPDEVYSSRWKLVFNESTVLFQRKLSSTIATTEWEIYINK